jgi:hypothetical protein
MSCWISSGESKPNAARLPMFSLMILWPFFHLLRFLQHGAANVVADVSKFGGLLDVFHGNLPAWRRMARKGQRYNPTLSYGARQFWRAFWNDRAVKLHITNTAGLNLFTAYGDDYAAVNQEKYQKT